ncbi:DUF4399 domain-containing protein [Zooshikella harenae]|uniref:DUF4399 domain-containing protein n=1 Tax=Zooshikella harenae TaxID=2827238 RepID=A0ABS5ZC75_9GAMM|nr:DUF4399 domain-containing protein [Zooshikella harenae]MBU2711363.1 DUF4399 domain-containing protein [Zooshikella harenae]
MRLIVNSKKALFGLALGLASLSAFAGTESLISKAPEGAKLYFISPQDGESVSKTVTVKFGLKGMGIAPAGIKKEGTGHHHLLIDVDKLPDMKQSLPANEHIKHFGGGQTETTITLKPGKHTLQLLLGNYLHIPHDKPIMSKKITITVKE